MNIKYVTNVRIPTSKAQGYAIMKMCSEFAKFAIVELFVPKRDISVSQKDPFDFYKLERNFKINFVSNPDFLGKTLKFGRLFYWIDILIFFVIVKFRLKFIPKDVLYTRDFLTLLFFSDKNFICLELHDIPTSKILFKRLIKKPKLFFVLNQNLKKELENMRVPSDKIHVFPSGVDEKEFILNMSKKEAREKIGLPANEKIVLYSGQFYVWKGVDTLAQAAVLLPKIKFVFVGGVEPELSEFKKRYSIIPNLIIEPFKERSATSLYRRAADILTVPNSKKGGKISTEYTSPLKLFSAMASKRPIVVSDLPSMREAISEKECVFAEPDNPKSFADAIERIFSDERFAEDIANNAFDKVKKYSWGERANKILDIIEKNNEQTHK